jgi:hypothetical protein
VTHLEELGNEGTGIRRGGSPRDTDQARDGEDRGAGRQGLRKRGEEEEEGRRLRGGKEGAEETLGRRRGELF